MQYLSTKRKNTCRCNFPWDAWGTMWSQTVYIFLILPTSSNMLKQHFKVLNWIQRHSYRKFFHGWYATFRYNLLKSCLSAVQESDQGLLIQWLIGRPWTILKGLFAYSPDATCPLPWMRVMCAEEGKLFYGAYFYQKNRNGRIVTSKFMQFVLPSFPKKIPPFLI